MKALDGPKLLAAADLTFPELSVIIPIRQSEGRIGFVFCLSVDQIYDFGIRC